MAERILITGTSGFIGSALGRALRERQGLEVFGVSRRPPLAGATDDHLAHDLATPLPSSVPRADVIVHCAARASPWGSEEDYHRDNVVTLRHMLEFAERTKPRRFVFISSSSVHYNFADQEGLREDTPWPTRPVSRYAASKRVGEAMVRGLEGVPWTILRPRAVFGPGDTVLFPRILEAARRGALPEIARRGASARTNLLFIDNLCRYVEAVVARDAGGVFLLTDREVIDVARELRGVFERLDIPPPRRRIGPGTALAAAGAMELAYRVLGRRDEPPATRFGVANLAYTRTFDITRAIEELGPPPVTTAEGIDAFVTWQKAQPA